MMQNVDAFGASAADAIASQSKQPVDGHIPIVASFLIGLVISALSTNIWSCGGSFWLGITCIVAYALWIGTLVEGGMEYLSPSLLPLDIVVRRKTFVFMSLITTILGIVVFSTWERAEKKSKDEDEEEDTSCGAYISRLLLLIFSIAALLFTLLLMSGQLGAVLKIFGITSIEVPPQAPLQFSFLTRSG